MSLSKLEKETIITFNEAEGQASIYTYNVKLQHKLNRLSLERPEEVKHIDTDRRGGETYQVSKKFVAVRPPRQLTQEQRERLAQVARANLVKNP